jgi:hypothetical protein
MREKLPKYIPQCCSHQGIGPTATGVVPRSRFAPSISQRSTNLMWLATHRYAQQATLQDSFFSRTACSSTVIHMKKVICIPAARDINTDDTVVKVR